MERAVLPASLAAYEVGRLTLDGEAPPSACLKELAITVGATFRATRRVQAAGTCTPILYVPAIDLKSCTVPCDA